MENTSCREEQAHPKTVTYLSNVSHTTLRDGYFGTLIIEMKANALSQIVKGMVSTTFENMMKETQTNIRHFLIGVIAGESNVEFNILQGKYRVMICAIHASERQKYQDLLFHLGIESKQYDGFMSVVISRRENMLELARQGLMTGSPEKYKQFVRAMACYRGRNTTGKEWLYETHCALSAKAL
jgi:hypothetical protein